MIHGNWTATPFWQSWTPHLSRNPHQPLRRNLPRNPRRSTTDFVEAARAEGLRVYLSSGYRDYATQNYLYQRKVGQYGAEVAKTIVAPPGTSEHQTGLACDITDQYYEFKDASLENTALYQWMSEHCQEYGFIVRFPKGKEDITGIIYEPWHFRYVGVDAATYIMENDLCLEEFLQLYYAG